MITITRMHGNYMAAPNTEMMIFPSLLVATALTTLSHSTPLSYSTYQRRGSVDDDQDVYVPYLLDGREASVNDIYWPQISEDDDVKIMNTSMANSIRRMKRIRSLSVTNSLDVLRDRVLLELARRKAHQDQQQINANRRILNSIGKRSMQNFGMYLPQHLKMKNERLFGSQLIDNPEQNELPFKSHLNKIDWYNTDDVADLYEKNNQLEQMETDDIGVL